MPWRQPGELYRLRSGAAERAVDERMRQNRLAVKDEFNHYPDNIFSNEIWRLWDEVNDHTSQRAVGQ